MLCIYDARKGREDVAELYAGLRLRFIMELDIPSSIDFDKVDQAVIERWGHFDLFAIKAWVDKIVDEEEFCSSPGTSCEHYQERRQERGKA